AGWSRINAQMIPMGVGGEFRYHDAGASGASFYRLNAVLKDGTESSLGNVRVSAAGMAPYSFAMAGGNPFNGRTLLSYSLPRAERVRIDVYTVAGQLVRSLVDRNETPG